MAGVGRASRVIGASLLVLALQPRAGLAAASRVVVVPGGVSSVLVTGDGRAYASSLGAIYSIDLRSRRLTAVQSAGNAIPSDFDPATGLMTVVGPTTTNLYDPTTANGSVLVPFGSFAALFANGQVWIPTYFCGYDNVCRNALQVVSLAGDPIDVVELGQFSPSSCAARSPGGGIVVMGVQYPPQLHAVGTLDRREVGVIATGAAPCPVAVSDDGRAVVASLLAGPLTPSSTATLQLVDVHAPQAPPRLVQVPHAGATGLALDPAHERAFATVGVVRHVDALGRPRDFHSRLLVLSLRRWRVERSIRLPRRLGTAGALATDGTHVIVAGTNGAFVRSMPSR